MWPRLARHVARVERGAEGEILWLLSEFRFVPGGRILFGLGNWRKSTLFNCYFLPIREDSVGGIARFLEEAMRTFAYGGGVGTNADVLRPRGAKVGNAGVESSGAVSFMELFSTLAGGHGRKRGPAGSPDAHLLRHPPGASGLHPGQDRPRALPGPPRQHLPEGHGRLFAGRPGRRALGAPLHPPPGRRSGPPSGPRRPGRPWWRPPGRAPSPASSSGTGCAPGPRPSTGGWRWWGSTSAARCPWSPTGPATWEASTWRPSSRPPFTKEARMDFAALEEAARLAVRFLDAVIDLGKNRHPLRAQREASLRSRPDRPRGHGPGRRLGHAGPPLRLRGFHPLRRGGHAAHQGGRLPGKRPPGPNPGPLPRL
jgi:ribonucleoside-diphosphate reductase alpha chain